MWAVVHASVIGSSHATSGAPCQDACNVLKKMIGDEDVLIIAIADGAGSASHSQIGSSEAVQYLVKVVSQADFQLQTIDQEKMRSWFDEVLVHLRGVSDRENVPIGEFACTLLLGIVWENGAIFGQIGDGAWVLKQNDAYISATWPETGEYANITVFVTTEFGLDKIQFQRFEGKIDGVAGFTDGIQSLVLNYAEKKPHVPFFNSMLSPLKSVQDETELIAPLQQFLASEVVTSRTDDDKTLVLASWRHQEKEISSDGTAE
jgi:hypothetical protein